MRRRQVVVGFGAVLAWPVVAQQAAKVPRVKLLWESPNLWPGALESFRRGLRDLGWVEGRNVVVEYRWAEGRFDRLHEIADELVSLNVDVIVAPSSIYTEAARQRHPQSRSFLPATRTRLGATTWLVSAARRQYHRPVAAHD